jgi:metallophosphoesterase (TIGR00282 family)
MNFHILAVGDVVGEEGLSFLKRQLPAIKKQYDIHFTVVNGENASGVGILPRQAETILDAGADVITLGNHTWNRLQIKDFLEDNRYILRPANFTGKAPGHGFRVYDAPTGLRIGVINLIGRCELDFNADNPFFTTDRILTSMNADIILVDFHAEATSEKLAMAHYLDGRVHALWGTHTHVPTADQQVFPNGMGYVTDLGMTGPRCSVLGMCPTQSINRFLGALPSRYEPAAGPCKLESVLFTMDTGSGRCISAARIDLQE